MINKNNYYDKLAKIDKGAMPTILVKSSELIDSMTQRGKDWGTYDSNANIKRVIDLYFVKFEAWLKTQKVKEPVKPAEAKPKKVTEDLKKKKPKAKAKPTKKPPAVKPKKDTGAGKKEPRHPEGGKLVAHLDEDVKLIKRYAHLHGRIKTDAQIMNLIDAVQKAIVEKRITKKSQYASTIDHIQGELVKLYNMMVNKGLTQVEIEFKASDLKLYEDVGHSEIKRSSVIFLKRYISLDGKKVTKAKAVALLDQMNKAIKTGKIAKNDPYHSEIIKAIKNLKAFIKAVPETLTIFKTELNGIIGKLQKERFTRPRSKTDFPTENIAWETIVDSTGLEPEDVVAQHTQTEWIWKIEGLSKIKDNAPKKKTDTKLPQERFTRSKNKFTSARAAWRDIAETSDLKPAEVVSEHTKTQWVWRLKDFPKIKTEKGQRKVARVLREFSAGILQDRQGKKVTKRPQAIAIATSEARRLEKGIAGVMSVEQVREREFKPIPLAAHWKQVIGDACPPMYMLVYGRGGSGKSGCALQLADHLTGMGYRLLFVAGEQFSSPTLKKLLEANNIRGNENFVLVESLDPLSPEIIKGFDFIVLDSKDSLNIGLEDFKELKKKFPKQSFIVVSQGKIDGEFRGGEQWRNEVDTLIRCEGGTASTIDQKNRWGSHGEIVIFRK